MTQLKKKETWVFLIKNRGGMTTRFSSDKHDTTTTTERKKYDEDYLRKYAKAHEEFIDRDDRMAFLVDNFLWLRGMTEFLKLVGMAPPDRTPATLWKIHMSKMIKRYL
jgi:hypothetical protein